jgi:hypothetical protein
MIRASGLLVFAFKRTGQPAVLVFCATIVNTTHATVQHQ